MSKTTIDWTDWVWNVTRGCSRCAPDCLNCYAERQAYRFSGPSQPYEGLVQIVNGRPTWTGNVILDEKKLMEPLQWRKPRRVFVNSMSDLFHKNLSNWDIARVFAVMAKTPHITYQILTKRAERMHDWFTTAEYSVYVASDYVDPQTWPLPNVHLGVSAGYQSAADERISWLRKTPATKRFVSYEPAIGPVDFGDLTGIDQIIVGGESGPGARPCRIEWIESTIEQCQRAGVACFVKQLGARPCNSSGWLNCGGKGNDMSRWPASLRVRETI